MLTRPLAVSVLLAATCFPRASWCADSTQVDKNFTSKTPSEHVIHVSKSFGIQPDVDRLLRLQAGYDVLADEKKHDAFEEKFYLRQRIAMYIQSAILDVDATVAYIDQENATIMDLQAKAIDARSRALKRENMINFVTGSVTKVSGKSLALGAFPIPDNVLDIIDGGVQGLLSVASIRSAGRENTTSHALPPPLLALLNNGEANGFRYPTAVWWFLNEQIPSTEMLPCQKNCELTGNTRRERLISKWTEDGFLSRQKRAGSESACSLTSRVMQTKSFSSKLLEDRSAMLTDLESVIVQIKEDLGVIARGIRSSLAADDPHPELFDH